DLSRGVGVSGSGGPVVDVVEDDEGGRDDGADARGAQGDAAQGFEVLQQGVAAFADTAQSVVQRVAGAFVDGQLAAGGLLGRDDELVVEGLVAEVGQHVASGRVPGLDRLKQTVGGAGTGAVVLAAGSDRRDPDRPAVRCGQHLDVAAVGLVLAGPPQVDPAGGARDGAAVGADHGAVEVDVGVAGHRGGGQRRVHRRGLVGQYRQRLVDVPVGGRAADVVVDGELGDPGRVVQPAQEQHRLVPGIQRSTPTAGTDLQSMARQQVGDEPRGRARDRQHSGVDDMIGHAGPRFGRRSVEGTTPFYRGPVSYRRRSPHRRGAHTPDPYWEWLNMPPEVTETSEGIPRDSTPVRYRVNAHAPANHTRRDLLY